VNDHSWPNSDLPLPTLKAFSSLAELAQGVFRRDRSKLYTEDNDATGGPTSITAEHLEIVAIKQSSFVL
jgi:hypothetical protein